MLHIFRCHTFYIWYFWYYPLITQRMQFAAVDLRCSDFDILAYYMLHILYVERFILPSDIATKKICSGEYMLFCILHIDIVDLTYCIRWTFEILHIWYYLLIQQRIQVKFRKRAGWACMYFFCLNVVEIYCSFINNISIIKYWNKQHKVLV